MGMRPCLGVDEGGDVLHGAGPVKSNHRRYIPQIRGLQQLNVALHTGAFQLEQVGSFAGREQVKGCLIIQRQAVQIYFYTLILVQQLDGPI